MSITLDGLNVSIVNPPYNKTMAVTDFMVTFVFSPKSQYRRRCLCLYACVLSCMLTCINVQLWQKDDKMF